MKRKLLPINQARTSPTGRRRLSVAGLATMEPLGLAYVAALTPLVSGGVPPSGWDVYIADEVVEEIPRDFRPDLVGLTGLTPTAPRGDDDRVRLSCARRAGGHGWDARRALS